MKNYTKKLYNKLFNEVNLILLFLIKYVKFSFKVGAKLSIFMLQKFFFDPSQKIKPSDQKIPLYTIYEKFYQLKLICTHQTH